MNTQNRSRPSIIVYPGTDRTAVAQSSLVTAIPSSVVSRSTLTTQASERPSQAGCIEAFVSNGASSFPGTLNRVPTPDPGTTGANPVCSHEFTYPLFSSDLEGQFNDAIVYAPGNMVGKNCQATASNCPLVLIIHADGTGVSHLSYDALGRHLASRGFVAISVNRDKDDGSIIRQGSIVGSLYRFLNKGGLGIKSITNNTTAIVGHSAGGKCAHQVTSVPAMEGWTLKCLCLMAPTIKSTKTLTGTVTAFMSIIVERETDPNAVGLLDVMDKGTGVKAFEDAAVVSSNMFAFAKHLVRVADGSFAGHYFQNQHFTLAYIAAFLHCYQKEEIIYQRFLKGQSVPASLKKVPTFLGSSHLHEDVARKLLVEIEDSEPTFETSATGISEVQFAIPFEIDKRCLHTKRVLKFKWDRAKSGLNTLKLFTVGSIDASTWKTLSFNIAQIYFSTRSAGPDVELQVSLISQSNGISGFSKLGVLDFGGAIRYPIKQVNSQGSDITRNVLRAINIPIAKFVDVGDQSFEISKVAAIEFNFSNNPVGSGQNAIFMVNEIKLLH